LCWAVRRIRRCIEREGIISRDGMNKIKRASSRRNENKKTKRAKGKGKSSADKGLTLPPVIIEGGSFAPVIETNRQPRQSRTQAQIERDRRLISQYYLMGRSQAEIGDMLNIDQSTVSRDIRAIEERWQSETTIDLTTAKWKEIRKLDLQEEEAWNAWLESKKQKKEQNTKSRGVPYQRDGKTGMQVIGTETSVKNYETGGDPRFLVVMHQCVKTRCEILGLYAPKLVAPVTPAGNALPVRVRVYIPDNKRNG